MAWFIYFFFTILLSYLISFYLKKNKIEIFVILLVAFVTPAQLDINTYNYSPSLFSFFYNVVLEKDFSTRVLRPLLLTMPASLFFSLIIFLVKKRFFSF